VNLKCPKCQKWFELDSRCSKTERYDVSDYLACPKCGYLLPSLEFVGEARWNEFLEWVNKHNKELEEGKSLRLPKSIWQVVVYDRALREVLVAEKIMKAAEYGDPSLRIVVRCSEKPDNTFVLGKFKEYLNKTYERGFIEPIIIATFVMAAEDGKYFDL